MINKEIIERFFLQQCNNEEVKAVIKHFEENPETLEEEWKAFQPQQDFPEEKSEMLWNNIENTTLRKKKVIYLFKKIAIAASIIVVIVLGGILFYNNSSHEKSAIATTTAKPTQKTIFNNGTEKINFTLSDGTIVSLMSQSSLSYPDTFITHKREVVLSGEAYFEIAKNKAQPFTVYSDALATTALGTKFLVKAYSGDKNIKISLLEGKVVIQSANPQVKTLAKDIYLVPGDVLLYNKAAKTASVIHRKTVKVEASAPADNIPASQHITGNNWYMFNNQSLSEVLDQLQDLYNLKIIYSKEDIKGMSFIGKIDRSDSLDNILHSIAILNSLKIHKRNGVYIIEK